VKVTHIHENEEALIFFRGQNTSMVFSRVPLPHFFLRCSSHRDEHKEELESSRMKQFLKLSKRQTL